MLFPVAWSGVSTNEGFVLAVGFVRRSTILVVVMVFATVVIIAMMITLSMTTLTVTVVMSVMTTTGCLLRCRCAFLTPVF